MTELSQNLTLVWGDTSSGSSELAVILSLSVNPPTQSPYLNPPVRGRHSKSMFTLVHSDSSNTLSENIITHKILRKRSLIVSIITNLSFINCDNKI